MPLWKRNLYIIWIAEFTAIVGFSSAFPFIPYYIQGLGVTGEGEVEFWTGLMFSGMALAMAVFSPLWGMLADRFGRKPMVVRAMLGGAVVLGLMGFARSAPQLLALRILQGATTGTVAAATTLVATTVPRERTASSVATLQMAVYLGASGGPLLGGLIADAFGYRPVFWLTGALLFTAGVLVLALVHEEFAPPEGKRLRPGRRPSLAEILELARRQRALLLALGADLLIRLGARVSRPMLPLFIQELLPETAKLASITGLISGVRALAGAGGALLAGYAADRMQPALVLLFSSAGAGAFYAAQYFAWDVRQVLVLQALTGVGMGGSLAVMSALLARLAPQGRQGVVYGVENSVNSIANAVGPMAGAFLAVRFGIRSVFLGAGGLFLLSVAGISTAVARGRARSG